MVDVVDLLDDSTDDEAEEQSKPSPADEARPTSSSSWLRDVVSNGYETTPSDSSARDLEVKSSDAVKSSAAKYRTANEDSNDEVVWIPTPNAKASKMNSATKEKSGATTMTTSQKQKPTDTYSCNGDTKDDSDSDVEVLVVDAPAARLKSSEISPAIASTRALQNKKFRKPIPKPALLDSDDDDDILYMKSSGLSNISQRQSAPSRGGSPIESSRKQFQTNVDKEHTKGRTPNNPNTVTTNTPRNYGSVKSNRNPYAKAKTPQSSSSVPKASGETSSGGSVSSSTMDLSSPFSTKSGIIMRNPYTSSSGKKRSKCNTAAGLTEAAAALTCGLRAPRLRANTKTYPDIRPNIVLALWKFARKNLVRDSYQAIRLDQFVGRIVDLVVSAPDFPIRSVGEYAIRKRGHVSKRGCGGLTVTGDSLKKFEEDLISTGVMESRLDPIPGKCFSISEACLVAIKEMVTVRWKANQSKEQGYSQSSQHNFPVGESGQAALFSQKEYFISLADLIPQVDRRLRPECPAKLERRGETDKGVSYYLNKSTRSAEFKQIEKLLAPVEIPKADGSVETTSYLKRRMIRGRQHYQLLPLGFRKAVVISRRSLPTSPGPYRFCNLHSVLPKYVGICLAVDFREGGAGDRYRKVLHEMCNKLDLQKIPYVVNTLRIGDYCFFAGDKLCPIIVERKSVEDVAKSIDSGDGRWVTQKARMYHGQYVFGYQNCRMAYIIEGKVEKHLVSNNFIGNARHKVTRERFEEEIANLEGEGFEVLRTCSVENSMFELCRWAESVARDIQSGRLKLEYTYNDFLEKVDRIPTNVDFSRLAKYHAEERKKSTVDLVSDSEQNGGYRGKLSPIVLDERLRKAEKRKVVTVSTDIGSIVGARKRFKLEECNKVEARERFPDSILSPAVISALAPKTVSHASQPNEGKNEYAKWTASALRDKCVELGMKKTGSKADLIERLMDPTNRPPPVYRLRQQRDLYVPAKLDTSSTAILVAIQIAQDSAAVGVERYGGATKDEIYVMADKVDIKKDPFCGGTTQTGPYRE